MKLYFFRHAMTVGNESHRYIGSTDDALSEAGVAEARRSGGCERVKTVYVTPLKRTRETAKILFPKAEQIIVDGLREMEPRLQVNGESGHPGILNCRFPGIRAEALTAKLSVKGICVSPGAACAARDPKPSHVLLAMGYSADRASQSIRFSLGRNTTEEEIDQTLAAVGEVLSVECGVQSAELRVRG